MELNHLNLKCRKGADKNKTKVNKYLIMETFSFMNNREILDFLAPFPNYQKLFKIKQSHFIIFTAMNNFTNSSTSDCLLEFSKNFHCALKEFKKMELNDFEEAYLFFLKYWKHMTKNSEIVIGEIDDSLLHFLTNKFTKEEKEFYFDIRIGYELFNKNSSLKEGLLKYFSENPNKIVALEDFTIYDSVNENLDETCVEENAILINSLINSNSTSLEYIWLNHFVLSKVIIEKYLVKIKEYVCNNKKHFKKSALNQLASNFKKMTNLEQIKLPFPISSDSFNQDNLFTNLLIANIIINNFFTEDFSLLFKNMSKLETLIIEISQDNNSIKYEIIKNNISELFSLSNLENLKLNLKDKNFDNTLLLNLSKLFSENKFKQLTEFSLESKYVFDKEIVQNFLDFIKNNETVINLCIRNEDEEKLCFSVGVNGFLETSTMDIRLAPLLILLSKRNNMKFDDSFTLCGGFRIFTEFFKLIIEENSLQLFKYISRIIINDSELNDSTEKSEEEMNFIFKNAMTEMTQLKDLSICITNENYRHLTKYLQLKNSLEYLKIENKTSFENEELIYLNMFETIDPLDNLTDLHLYDKDSEIEKFLMYMTKKKFLFPNLEELHTNYSGRFRDDADNNIPYKNKNILEVFLIFFPYLKFFDRESEGFEQ